MKPMINKGNVVIIDSARKPSDGSLVLVRLTLQDEIIFRKVSLINQPQLIPSNLDMYKPIPLKEEDIILGTAIEVRVQL